MDPICHNCNQPVGIVYRVNPIGETGIFWCQPCIDIDKREAVREMKRMTDEELELVPFTPMKWQCQGKGCTNGTIVRDYGIGPIYFHPRKNIRWFDIRTMYWCCSKHNKLFKRLLKSFLRVRIEQKIMDWDKERLVPTPIKKPKNTF